MFSAVFFSPIQANIWVTPRSGHDRFLPNLFQFAGFLSAVYPTPHDPNTEKSVVK
jgi:hypothetical protein